MTLARTLNPCRYPAVSLTSSYLESHAQQLIGGRCGGNKSRQTLRCLPSPLSQGEQAGGRPRAAPRGSTMAIHSATAPSAGVATSTSSPNHSPHTLLAGFTCLRNSTQTLSEGLQAEPKNQTLNKRTQLSSKPRTALLTSRRCR